MDLVDPSFEIILNGMKLELLKLANVASNELELKGIGKLIVHQIDANINDRTTRLRGITWWYNGRMIGDPSWEGLDGEGNYLDGRTAEAKRFTFIAEADAVLKKEDIRVYDKLLLVLSPDSMNSEWVKTEIYHARQKKLCEKRQVLFPIRLCDFDTIRQWQCFDADTGTDLAREIREYYIPGDFQNWKDHAAFELAFAKLFKDLRASDHSKP